MCPAITRACGRSAGVSFPELEIYAQQLSQVPLSVGEWEGEEGRRATNASRKSPARPGELNRVYRNAAGEEVRGDADVRRLSRHLRPLARSLLPGRRLRDDGQAAAEHSTSRSTRPNSSPRRSASPIRTGTQDERGYWSWTSDGNWLAPKNERLTYGGERALYKLYVFASAPAASRGRPDSDFRVDFIREFVPALTRALMPGFKKAERARKGELVDVTPAPAAKQAQPEAKQAQPEAKQAQPEAKQAQPEAKQAQPETKKAEPAA